MNKMIGTLGASRSSGGVDYEFVTTEAVISEAIYKIQKDKNLLKAVAAVTTLLDDVSRNLYILHLLKLEDFSRIRELRQTYSDQRRLDFADMSLVVAAEQTRISEIVTIDRKDFEKLRWKNGKETCAFTVIEPDYPAPLSKR